MPEPRLPSQSQSVIAVGRFKVIGVLLLGDRGATVWTTQPNSSIWFESMNCRQSSILRHNRHVYVGLELYQHYDIELSLRVRFRIWG